MKDETKKTVKGPAVWFTGDVYFNDIARGQAPSRVRVNLVRFTPGARTAWHQHSLGQTLHVTDGLGYVQETGGELVKLNPVIHFTPTHTSGTGTEQLMITLCHTLLSGKMTMRPGATQ